MSRFFALLVEQVVWTPIRGPRLELIGSAMGPVPPPHTALALHSAFGRSLSLLSAGGSGVPQGGRSDQFSIAFRQERLEEPDRLRGAILCDEGVSFRSFTGFFAGAPYHRGPARVVLDHPVGLSALVESSQGLVTVHLIGGGLREGEDLWPRLRRIDLGAGQVIEGQDVRPFQPKELPPGWAWGVPAVANYRRGESGRVLAVRPAGPALLDGLVWTTEDVATAHFEVQQPQGLTQFEIFETAAPLGIIGLSGLSDLPMAA